MPAPDSRHRRALLPHWFTGSVAFGAAPVPWRDSLRSALTLPAVTGAGYAIGGPGVALYASLSALLVVLSERSGTTGQRMLRSAGALAGGTLAIALGPATGGAGVGPLLAVLAFGLLSGVASGLGSGPSFAAMQLLVQMSIAGGIRSGLGLCAEVLAYVVGGITALLAMWLQSALERTDRHYPAALADAARTLGDWAGEPGRRDLSHRADAALGVATDLVLHARPLRPGRRARLAAYRAVLATVTVLATALRTRPVPAGAAAALHEYADRIAGGGPPGPVALPPVLAGCLPVAPPPAPHPVPVGEIVRARLTDPRSWAFVGRLELCLLVAEVVRQLTPFGHSYWIVLTVALCLKPDIASVFSRTLQRALGTALGIVLGFVATPFAAGYGMLPILGVLCGLIPWAVRRNYWAFSVLVTPLVLLLLDYGGPVGPDVLVQRLVNTVTGGVIVLVFGYALVPGTWFPPFAREERRLTAAIVRLARPGTPLEAALQRSAVTVEITALRGRAAQAGAEPRPVRVRAARWEQVADRLDAALAEATRRLPVRT